MNKLLSKATKSDQGAFTSLLQFALFLFTRPGARYFGRIISRNIRHLPFFRKKSMSWNEWFTKTHSPEGLRKAFEEGYPALVYKPVFSILLPAGDQISATIESLKAQLYPHWKILQDPASSTTGEYIVTVQAGDTLTPDCLFQIAKYIAQHPGEELIYADNDTIAADGIFCNPQLKPDWSPHTLKTANYIGHNIIAARSLVQRKGGLNGTNTDDEVYEFILNTELPAAHIAKVLFHVRERGVTPPATKRERFRFSPGTPLVSIIIPTRDQAALLKVTIDSILELTHYPAYEIIVVDNNSGKPETRELLKNYADNWAVRVINAAYPFNFSRLINDGVENAKGTLVLMLNNDMKVTGGNWLEEMVKYAQLPDSGAVGAKLIFPDGTLQHAGIALGMGEATGHLFANSRPGVAGYLNHINRVSNVSAVTGACLMCRKTTFLQIGGMDEQLPVEYNDVDLCLKFRAAGLYNVYLPQVVLYHYESATRGHPFRNIRSYRQHERDLGIFQKKWGHLLNTDPYFGSYLALLNASVVIG